MSQTSCTQPAGPASPTVVMGMAGLFPELHGLIACGALQEEDDSLEAWQRLRLVSKAWRDGLQGVPVRLKFEKPTTRRQQDWLLATRIPLRSISFHPDDQASLSLQTGGPLASSERTLEEAHGMWVPPTCAGFSAPSPMSLAHFVNLKALTLQGVSARRMPVELRLPPSLVTLTLDQGPQRWDQGSPPPLQLQGLTRLTTLSLLNFRDDMGLWAGDEQLRPLCAPASLRLLRICQDGNLWVRLQNGGLQRPNVRLDPSTADQVTVEVSTKHAVAFAARGPEPTMTPGDWCWPVCKGFERLRLSFQSMAIYPSGAAAKCPEACGCARQPTAAECLGRFWSLAPAALRVAELCKLRADEPFRLVCYLHTEPDGQGTPQRRLPAQCEDYATTADLAVAMAPAAVPLAVGSTDTLVTLARNTDAAAVA